MNKQIFIAEISPVLKKMGFRKNGYYWYKTVDEHICCVNVQGSQWDKEDYYVQIGFAYFTAGCNYPTILNWHCRHRCQGVLGEKNIQPQEFFACINEVFEQVTLTSQIPAFLKSVNGVSVAKQIWF